MSALHRELAPLCDAAWRAIDTEAKTTLELRLAGRRIADFEGPLGWQTAAIGTGRVTALAQPIADGVVAGRREVQPLVELRVPFCLERSELDALARGARDPDLRPVTAAAGAIALAEDRAIFAGFAAAGIVGIGTAAAGAALALTDDYVKYPGVVANALANLRERGIQGPYGIALGPRCYTGLTRTTTAAGYPVIAHVERLLDGPLIWAPAVDGAVVLSLRGGDFALVVGGDLSVGYQGHTATTVELCLEESFTFRVLCADAAVPLVYDAAKV